jgi:hypothetical protein
MMSASAGLRLWAIGGDGGGANRRSRSPLAFEPADRGRGSASDRFEGPQRGGSTVRITQTAGPERLPQPPGADRPTDHDRTIARPFDWNFTRSELNQVLAEIADREPNLRLTA